jgi:hypothetical protein
MSGGGGYTITNNEGRLDQLILGNQLLSDRIAYVTSVRAGLIAQGQLAATEAQPSLGDIEQTHLIFVHAMFKSYVSIAYEYYKTNPQGGSPTLKLASTTPISFLIPQYGDFIGDVAMHTIIEFPTLSNSTDYLVRACDYPGIRLLQNTSITINSNELDSYDESFAIFTKQFTVSGSPKEAAFNRCVGQEELLNVSQVSYAQYAMNGSAAGPRMWSTFSNGAQTPQPSGRTDVIEMFIPLLLFHQDIRLSLPTVCLPTAHRYFNFTLASVQQLFGVVPKLVTAPAAQACTLSVPSVDIMELYINNIFIHDDVHDIYIDRIGFNLIRVHKAQDFNLTTGSDTLQLSQFKFPTETIFVGARPTINLNMDHNSGSNYEDQFLTMWHKFSSIATTAVSIATVTPVAIPALTFRVPTYTNTITSLSILSQGVILYNDFPVGLFNSYIPYNFGSVNITAPKSGDASLMITFNFYPGTYQPSGYVNISRSREFYIKYISSFVTTGTPCTLICRSVAIDFLVINDGNAYLRYLT